MEKSGPRSQTADGVSAPDLVLVQRCARRDPAALREIVGRYQQRLYRFLLPILGSPEDTEEAVQDAFLRVWQQADRFERRASFSTWLYRIVANVAYDQLRRRKAQCRTTPLVDAAAIGAGDAEEAALDRLERGERARRLREALQTLRAEDRLLLVLYYGEEMDYAQMGEVTRFPYLTRVFQ
ncbi:MAG: sigma-70 family RNA polymerase sigma factor [Armatimonadetes bacterium]|nr:sigma-70 family RNA polymerase sigma factor [Armatimonadota bacterium]